ncbi:hypothetical protein [Corynebacterium timonense]|uniref:Uncharacterized protein n=1 Tax=Corynebacterium timonense TaxID=441500 RepID=A0A1H1LQ53_9CORY|nr:hypothetical protein [Corynebacterium timonense]SDR75939.1 hypothetical protein SAMN04488539_0279 [Corynebacterium timonense]
MATLTDLAAQTAATLDIDEAAARDALTTYLRQVEALDSRTIDPDDINPDDAAFLTESVRQAQRAGDLGTRELDHLADAVEAHHDAVDSAKFHADKRDRHIIAALRAGARMKEVTEITGLSRARIQQITRKQEQL